MEIEQMMKRLPPAAQESVQRIAFSTMENDEDIHCRILASESDRMTDILTNRERFWWLECVHSLTDDVKCMIAISASIEGQDSGDSAERHPIYLPATDRAGE